MREDNDRNLELLSLFHQEKSEDEENKVVNYLDKVKGFTVATAYVSAVVVSATCYQLLVKRIPDFELNTIRLLTVWILMIILLLAKRKMPKTDKFKLTIFFFHNICASGISLPYFIAVTLTAVTSVHCIFITSGITSGLFIFLFAVKEKITVKKVVCALLCIIGVTLVVQPYFLFNGINQTENKTGHPQSEIDFLPNNATRPHEYVQLTVMRPVFTILGFILPIMAGISISCQTALVKRYPFIGEDVVVAGFWSLLFSIILSTVLVGIFENPTLPLNWADVLYICGHSFGYAVIWTSNIIAAL